MSHGKLMNSKETSSTAVHLSGQSDWPDEQTLLLYLISPEQLTADQHTELLSWLSSAPEHAERLSSLAIQVCEIVDHVREIPIAVPSVVTVTKSPTHRHRYGWVAIAASVLVAAWWWQNASSKPSKLTDEVAMAWATQHDSVAISGSELWSSESWASQDIDVMSELLKDEPLDVPNDMALDDGEQSIGFTDSDPPEWLVAAFVESDTESEVHLNSAEDFE